MQILPNFRKRTLTYKIIVITLFSLFLINNIIFYIQPFAADTIFEYYTTGYFKIITSFQHIVFGFIPISIGDVLYIIIAFYLLVRFFQIIYLLFSRRFQTLLTATIKTFFTVTIFWLLLGSQWNWNYLQPSLEEKLNLDTSDYDVEELADFTLKLIDETSHNKEYSNFDVFSSNTNSILDIAPLGYKTLAKKDKFYTYKHPSIKYSLFSDILPFMGISGYYNPFTAEAQITKNIPIVQIPFVINHEIAHQLGIASESEANFIGYLASINNPLNTIQYSGHINLLMYCLSDLRKREYKNYDKVVAKIPKNVKDDMNEIYNFWTSYRNEFRKYTDKGYDKFLKSNKQKEGLKSYNKVVSLAIFYNRKN